MSLLVQNKVVWLIQRKVLLLVFRQSSRRVLLSRPLLPSESPNRRWFQKDIADFISGVEVQVETLRETAKLNQFQTVGNRLMVELSVFTVGAYCEMLNRGLGRKEASAVIADIGWDIYARMLRLSSLPHRLTTQSPELR